MSEWVVLHPSGRVELILLAREKPSHFPEPFQVVDMYDIPMASLLRFERKS